MPSTNIIERDLTNQTQLDVTENIVYIPGYANYGPVNEPTLCSSVDDFHSKFGYKPYMFTADSTVSTITVGSNTYGFTSNATPEKFYSQGNYERSFIYAEELLRRGLKVLYERVVSGDRTASVTLTDDGSTVATLKAKYYGSYGTKIKVKIIRKEVGTKVHFEVYEKRDAFQDDSVKAVGVNAVPITFTFDPENTDYTLYRDVKFNLFDVVWESNISASTDIVEAVVEADSTDIVEADGSDKAFQLATGNDFTVEMMYKKFVDEDFFDRFSDKTRYPVKILTTGVYPVFEFGKISGSATNPTVFNAYDNLLKAVAERGDAEAIVDSTNPASTRSLDKSNATSVYSVMKGYVNTNPKIVTRVDGTEEDVYTYSGLFLPHAIYPTEYGNQVLPGSFSYTLALARSIAAKNPDYLAIAGQKRGLLPIVPNGLLEDVTMSVADSYQLDDDVSINAITYDNAVGYVIWGNRTLRNNAVGGLKATSLLNIRMLACDIKRVVAAACRKYTFENNTDVLWVNFRSDIEPTLDQMVSGEGLEKYKITKLTGKKKTSVVAKINIFPNAPVENWFIYLDISDATTSEVE